VLYLSTTIKEVWNIQDANPHLNPKKHGRQNYILISCVCNRCFARLLVDDLTGLWPFWHYWRCAGRTWWTNDWLSIINRCYGKRQIFLMCFSFGTLTQLNNTLGRPTTWHTTSCFPTIAKTRFEISNYSWSNEGGLPVWKTSSIHLSGRCYQTDDCDSVITSSRCWSRKCSWTSLIPINRPGYSV
jgi:hypothetical protein